MGVFYEYACTWCDFIDEYYIGGGFLSEDYFNKTEKLESELKADVISGKYGNIIQAMAEADTSNKLVYSCRTKLFQCKKCKALKIWREKRVYFNNIFKPRYSLKLDINQQCPDCSSNSFNHVESSLIYCPKCKNESLKMISLGSWD